MKELTKYERGEAVSMDNQLSSAKLNMSLCALRVASGNKRKDDRLY